MHQMPKAPDFYVQNLTIQKARSSKDECSTGDQTIILGLQIFLDKRSLSSVGQKILVILPPSPSPLVLSYLSIGGRLDVF